MDEHNTLNEVDEAVSEVDTSTMSNDELKEAVNKTLEKVRNDAIILGYRVACTTIMQIISKWHEPNCSHREYERIFKRVEEFCSKVMKHEEDTAEPADAAETVQN